MIYTPLTKKAMMIAEKYKAAIAILSEEQR